MKPNGSEQAQGLSVIVEQETLRECEQGLRETIRIYRQIGIPDAQIAFMFRSMAEELQAPVIIHDAGHA